MLTAGWVYEGGVKPARGDGVDDADDAPQQRSGTKW